MARRAPADPGIGQRIKARRELLGLSMRSAAATTGSASDHGISHATWSRIERGLIGADNRFTLAAIAQALRCPVAQLLGVESHVSRDPVAARAQALAYEVVRAIVDVDLEYPAAPSGAPLRPLEELAATVALVRSLRARCDYTGALRLLPELVGGLHAHASRPDDGQQRADALRLFVLAGEAASFMVRYVGERPGSALIAERVQAAADHLGDRTMVGMGDWARAHAAIACGLYPRAATIAQRGIDRLSPHVSTVEAQAMIGQLWLTAAYARYGCGVTDVVGELNEAQRLAEATGDTDVLGLFFGPTNIRFWQVSMDADGDAGRAVNLARATTPAVVTAISRQAAFYIDTGRALAHTRGQDRQAVRMLLTAERLAPQRVHTDRLVSETLRTLLERSRAAAAGVELRGLCERSGVGA